MNRRFVSGSLAKAAGATAPAQWLSQWLRTAPPTLKIPLLARAAQRLHEAGPVQRLQETNLGIAPDLRVAVPASKVDLLYGRPDHNLSERATVELVKRLSHYTRAFIDVGANEGLYTFAVAKDRSRRTSLDLHAFEPDPRLFHRLQDNIRRNGLKVRVNREALSDHDGRGTFHQNLTSDLSGSLTDHFTSAHQTSAIEVPVTTLAGYLSRHDVDDAGIKVDVEGGGDAVWRGATGAHSRIAFLIVEMLRPELDAALPRRIIEETGWNAYYIRDYELVRSLAGEFTYKHPFYNWLFTRLPSSELQTSLQATRFRVLSATADAVI